ncbi:MAG: hypothetical protein KAJ51_17185 [Thermoplasmata archaeon]|nr:hypothetical protein [Thermoplasmata archaeon]
MSLGRYKLERHCNRVLCGILIIILLAGLIPIGSITFISEASAGTKKYDVTISQGKIPIPKDDYKTIDIIFDEGKELEVVYTVQVKDNLPIDIFFVNEDNYFLLTQNAQFLFLIDGTGQELSYTKKIVTLTKHDNYKIVMTNYYANQSVEVDVTYELRAYGIESEEESTGYPDIMIYSLIIVMIIIGVLLVLLFILARKLKQTKEEKSNKSFTGGGSKAEQVKAKKTVKAPPKKAKPKKAVKAKPKETVKAPPKKGKPAKTEQTVTKASEDEVGGHFCGHCGAQSDTPFCKQCGKKI